MKIDFNNISVQISFDGTKQSYNVAKEIGNAMRYTGSVIGDIGFDKLAEEIYFSKGEVEIPNEYISPLVKVVSESVLISAIKREIIAKLTRKEQ